MDKSNYFIENKAIFGVFPSQEDIYELENNGVCYFLDLTINFEPGTERYITQKNYENYPIQDRGIPTDTISYTMLILKYANIIKGLSNNKKVYIHCRGGHGRSGMVAACLLVFINKINAYDAMHITSKYHSERSVITEKWRKLGSPQSKIQRNFVSTFFRPFYMFIGLYYQKTPYFGFCKSILEIYNNVIIELSKDNNGENIKDYDVINSLEKYENLCDKLYRKILDFFIDNIRARDQLLKTGLSKLIFNYSILYKVTISDSLEQIRLKFYNEMLMM